MSDVKKRKTGSVVQIPDGMKMSTAQFIRILWDSNTFAKEEYSFAQPVGLTQKQISRLSRDIEEHNALPGVADIKLTFSSKVVQEHKHTPMAVLLLSINVSGEDERDAAAIRDLVRMFSPYLIGKDSEKILTNCLVDWDKASRANDINA